MAAPDEIPDISCADQNGNPVPRIEMENRLRHTWPKPYWLRIKANKMFGLPKQPAFEMKESVLRHWVLDEMTRRGLITGDLAQVNPQAHEDDNEQKQLTQRLIALVHSGQAIAPSDGEGVNMSQQPNVPNTGMPNGQQAVPFQPPAPPPMGGPGGFQPLPPGPQMAPQQFAPPGPPPGFAPPQAPPQFAPQGPPPGFAPPQPQQSFAPPMPPGMGPGGFPGQPQFAPQVATPPFQGVPQGPPGFPPQAAPPAAPSAPPQEGGGKRGRKAAATAGPPAAAAPQAAPPSFQGPPAQTQGFALPAPQQFALPQPVTAQPAVNDQLNAQVSELSAQVKNLTYQVALGNMALAIAVRGIYQKQGSSDIENLIKELGLQLPSR